MENESAKYIVPITKIQILRVVYYANYLNILSKVVVNIEENTVLFNAEVKVVSVFKKNNLKPCALPQEILEKLNGRK